ncbi:NAD kinase [Kribbella sp. NPDC006257]|uniref:NAD kinase n=1 Tax=Kribbella sp. NPDC006257 TaxID=3156738 RepID=UPI00339DCE89
MTEEVGSPVVELASDPRRVLLVAHTGREFAVEVARQAHRLLTGAGLVVRLVGDEAEALELDPVEIAYDAEKAAQDVELIIVLGGDGSILRGAELARPHGTPVLGVNLGHVGFLAEAEVDDLERIVQVVVDRTYTVEERMTLAVDVWVDDELVFDTWALNEASIEKAAREKMLEVLVEVDGRPLSRWGCDGVVVATPTGSTAYAFSAGGPIVWPEVEAILMVPLSAHALFSRPIVVAPTSRLSVELVAAWHGRGVLWCDGRRMTEVPPGARIGVRRGKMPVRLARAHEAPFTDRLVAKFDLPVLGWRGTAERNRRAQEETQSP